MDFMGDGGYPDDMNETLRKVISLAAKPGMICFEIGTYAGRSALVQLPIIKDNGGHLYCVDWFKGNVGGQGPHAYNPAKRPALISTFLANIYEAGYEDIGYGTGAR